MNEHAKSLAKHFLKEDPEVEFRIQHGIETNRKGFGSITLVDADDQPIRNATVKLTQKSHEYEFGCNLFLLDEFPEAEQNAAYAEIFKEVFNLGVIPFYWSDLEPEDGAVRFDKNSPKIYRRPPPDLCLEYCEKNGITPKGHPLVWHNWYPSWLKGTKLELERRIERRFREIGERYADRIHNWDVVNEAYSRNALVTQFPDDYVELGYKLAGRYLSGNRLNYNDDANWFFYKNHYSPVYMLVRQLLDKGLPVNGLGLQYHLFQWHYDKVDTLMNPIHILRCLDLYEQLDMPVNLSEISIISRRDLGDGDAFQEIFTEKLYRLWFSHACTNGIIWWNLVDGTGANAPMGSEDGENSLRAGLINYDFTPKRAYTAIKRLIKEEWTTKTALEYHEGAINKFHGFYGDYDVVIESAKGTLKTGLKLSKDGFNNFRFTLK